MELLPHIQPTCAEGLYWTWTRLLLSPPSLPTFRKEHYFQIFRLEVCLVYNWVNERKKINDVVGVGIMCSHFRQGDCHYWIILQPGPPSPATQCLIIIQFLPQNWSFLTQQIETLWLIIFFPNNSISLHYKYIWKMELIGALGYKPTFISHLGLFY